MNNLWIVVPVISNGVDLASYVNKLSGGYTAPETYEKTIFNSETQAFEKEDVAHPYAGQASHDFSNKIIFVNKVDGYNEYDGVVHLEDFNEINIYRYWNTGLEHAFANGADSVILTNGIFDFDPFIIKDAYDEFYNGDSEVINISDGAMLLVSESSNLRADEQFQIWFGDNDFYRRAEPVLGYYRSEYPFGDYLIHTNSTDSFDSIVASDEVKYNAKWS
jgi:hypothetical protein